MPTCVELMTCNPDFSNPLQWLDVFGIILGLPREFGIISLLGIIVLGIYIRTGNLLMLVIAGLLILNYATFTLLNQFMGNITTVIIMIIVSAIILVIYKIKSDLI